MEKKGSEEGQKWRAQSRGLRGGQDGGVDTDGSKGDQRSSQITGRSSFWRKDLIRGQSLFLKSFSAPPSFLPISLFPPQHISLITYFTAWCSHSHPSPPDSGPHDTETTVFINDDESLLDRQCSKEFRWINSFNPHNPR